MTITTVIIPFTSDDVDRRHAYRIVAKYFNEEFPHWRRRRGVCYNQQFSKAVAVNQLVAETDAEVIILNDADTLVPADQVGEAARRVSLESGVIVQAFTGYKALTGTATEALTPETYLDAFQGPFERTQPNSEGHGCVAIQRQTFLELGGYDHRYQGHGFEDRAFNEKARQAGVRFEQIAGPLVHLWHPRPEPSESNRELFLLEHGA